MPFRQAPPSRQKTRIFGSAPQIVWLRIGNSSKKELLAWISNRIDAIENHLQLGERLVEVR